jgi:mono/diheme cytochrome c family protein
MRIVLIIAGILGLGALGGFVWLRSADGFSARSKPTSMESVAARVARKLALPAGAREKQNPVSKSPEVLVEAMGHWADHCAICHGNDGSGKSEMGGLMYPPAPDMRAEPTQRLTDGELFYIIEIGIRLTGMPGWGGSEGAARSSWKLVHLVRHLTELSPVEIAAMEKMNPKGPEDRQREEDEALFLNGGNAGNSHEKEHK